MKAIFLFFLLFTFCHLAFSQKQKHPLVVATYALDQHNRLENLQPLARHLEQTLHRPVQAVSYPTIPALLTAIRAQEIDVALVNTYGFLLLSHDAVPAVQSLVTLETPPGQKNYQACLFASRLSGIQRLEELKNRPGPTSILLAGEHSTSGNHLQRQFLRQNGFGPLEEVFEEVQYTQSHAQVVQQVKSGLAEVGACGLDELLHQLQNWQVHPEDITLLWTSGQIPLGPVVVKASLPAELRQQLQASLTQLHVQNSAAFRTLLQGWPEARGASRFQPFSTAHAQDLAGLLR
ncbi:phosphate/phosphite/phosphonate ABC transporter substrate-binding protein [Rufibacter roseolus]|uniref:phosphate/phosphite/phosphonate ABC transporter substrate-binding protein n=1 Tax=Rufibacter roseolus TaxID=2817375 RepID=UPI001B30EEF7|nr:phosphate/phosphite/phosphonate ABC transporter substrate-binding protein [Rufibacter roseolus]